MAYLWCSKINYEIKMEIFAQLNKINRLLIKTKRIKKKIVKLPEYVFL